MLLIIIRQTKKWKLEHYLLKVWVQCLPFLWFKRKFGAHFVSYFWYQESGVEKWFILTLSSQCDQNCNHGRSSSMRPEKQYELTEDDTTTFFWQWFFLLSNLLGFLSSLKVSTERTLMDLLLHFSEWLKSSMTLVATYNYTSFTKSRSKPPLL